MLPKGHLHSPHAGYFLTRCHRLLLSVNSVCGEGKGRAGKWVTVKQRGAVLVKAISLIVIYLLDVDHLGPATMFHLNTRVIFSPNVPFQKAGVQEGNKMQFFFLSFFKVYNCLALVFYILNSSVRTCHDFKSGFILH